MEPFIEKYNQVVKLPYTFLVLTARVCIIISVILWRPRAVCAIIIIIIIDIINIIIIPTDRSWQLPSELLQPLEVIYVQWLNM